MLPCLRFGWSTRLDCSIDRKSTRLNSSHTVIYTLSLHDALPISTAGRLEDKSYDFVTPLQRDVAVLALRLVDALGLQHAEGADQLRAGLAGLDDVVDVATLCRRVGVGEVGFVVVDQFL